MFFFYFFFFNHNDPTPPPPSLLPTHPSHGRRFPKNNMRRESGACVDSGRQCGAQKSHPRPQSPRHHHPHPPPHPFADLITGRSWCPTGRTISLQKSQGTTPNPNKVAVQSGSGHFPVWYPWVMDEVCWGGRLGEKGGGGGAWGGSVGVCPATRRLRERISDRSAHR